MSRAAYARAAGLFRTASAELSAGDLALPVPSCPAWTVSDLLTHVADNHVAALERHGVDDDTADLLAVYEKHLADDARTRFQVLDLTIHAWDLTHARGSALSLDEASLDFLETFAIEAGDRLYDGDAFDRLDVPADELALATADRHVRVLAAYGRDAR